MGSTEITVVRHGETEWNVAMQLQGHLDSPLTEKGKKQVYLLAKLLKHRQFDEFYVSDLERARHTAHEINKYQDLKIIESANLRERAFGVMESLTREEVFEKYPEVLDAYNRRDPEYQIPEGESLIAFYNRIGREINRIANKHAGKKVLLVAHGGVLDCVIRKIFNLKLDEVRGFTIPNASINTITVDNGKWILNEWGNIEHLQQEPVLNEMN